MFPAWCSEFGSGGKFKSPSRRWSGVTWVTLGACRRAQLKFLGFEASIRLSPENAWVYHNRGQVGELAGDRENAVADYQKALSKKNPALTPKRKAHAQARIRELSNYS
jgi:hypothetical protein